MALSCILQSVNLPNTVTLSRIPLMLVLVVFLAYPFPGARVAALLVFLFAAMTDWLDGWLARRMGQISDFGKFMDALTDKIFTLGLFVSLLTLLELKKNFRCPVGFSDHTIDGLASISAVSMGASIIEKHVTIDKTMSGPDHQSSSTIKEFKELIKNIRLVEKIIGSKKKRFSKKDEEIFKVARKSIVTARNIYPGEKMKPKDICYKRPGTGFSPLETNKVLGKKVKQLIKKNTLISKKHFH